MLIGFISLTVRKIVEMIQTKVRMMNLSEAAGKQSQWATSLYQNLGIIDIFSTKNKPMKNHWAFRSINQESLDQVDNLINKRLPLNSDRIALLEKVVCIYEIIVMDGLYNKLSDHLCDKQISTAASKCFDIYCLINLPENIEDRIFYILKLASLACCGDRRSDLQHWFTETNVVSSVPSMTDASWDLQLLYRLFECWIYLFNGDNLVYIHEIVDELRKAQKTNEKILLNKVPMKEKHTVAMRLVGYYHWAKATEVLAEYILQAQTSDVFDEINKHFELGISAIATSGNIRFEMTLRWLHIASRILGVT